MNSENKQNDKDIIRLPNALSVNGPQKAKNHRISKSSLNNEEWEIFFVLDDDKANDKVNKKLNQQATDKNTVEIKNQEKPEKNSLLNDGKSELVDHLNLDDLEWDDTGLAFDEEDQLIFEKTNWSTSLMSHSETLIGGSLAIPQKF